MQTTTYTYARQSGGRYPRLIIATANGIHWPVSGQAQKDLSSSHAWNKPLPTSVHVQLQETRPNGQWTEYVHVVAYNETLAKPVVILEDLHALAWPQLTVSEAFEAFSEMIAPFTCTMTEFKDMLSVLWKTDMARLSKTENALQQIQESCPEIVTRSFTLYQPTHKFGWKCALITMPNGSKFIINRHTEPGLLASDLLVAQVHYSPGHRGGTYDFHVTLPLTAQVQLIAEKDLQSHT